MGSVDTYGIDQLGLRIHKQIIISGLVNNPPSCVEYMKLWFTSLIEKIQMKILSGPYLVYCDVEGNRGLTGVAIIETSHIALHAWDEVSPGLIELDIFSCKDFDVNDVIDSLREFDLVGIDFKCIDRTSNLEDKKMWVVYKTANNINNKVYIGVHGDYSGKYNYLGSGSALKASVKKYGRENFTHSIIKIFTNSEEAYEYEKSIVDAEFVKNPNTYNLAIGGRGSSECSDETKEKISISHKGKKIPYKWITDGERNLLIKELEAAYYITNNKNWTFGRTVSEETRLLQSKRRKRNPSHRKGKTVSEETKEKTRNTMLAKFENGYTVHNKGKSKRVDIN